MNIGEKAFVFALGALFVVGVAAVATSATGAPDKKLNADGASTGHVEIVETNGENGTFSADGVKFEVNRPGGSGVTSSEDVGERVDRYDGVADHYHVPVDAVDDDEPMDGRYDHDFDPSEVGPPTEFAGATGYVVEADKVDKNDPRVVAHVAENDPEIDGIAHAEDVETRELGVGTEDCRREEDGTEVCRISLNDTDGSE
jgi:hypothetical protein